MCNFFDKRGYPASVVQAGHHRAQRIDRQSALQTSQKENNNRIPFTLTFHPHNHAVKSIIFKNFKLLQNDPDTGRIFSQPRLISFKRDKNIGNFLVSSVFKTSEQPGTFKCAHARCKTCPFIYNVEKLSGPKRSIKITDHFTCTSANDSLRQRANARNVSFRISLQWPIHIINPVDKTKLSSNHNGAFHVSWTPCVTQCAVL